MLSVFSSLFNAFGSALTFEYFFVLLCFPVIIALFSALINMIKG